MINIKSIPPSTPLHSLLINNRAIIIQPVFCVIAILFIFSFQFFCILVRCFFQYFHKTCLKHVTVAINVKAVVYVLPCLMGGNNMFIYNGLYYSNSTWWRIYTTPVYYSFSGKTTDNMLSIEKVIFANEATLKNNFDVMIRMFCWFVSDVRYEQKQWMFKQMQF